MHRFLILFLLIPFGLGAQINASYLDTVSFKGDTVLCDWQVFHFENTEGYYLVKAIAPKKDSVVTYLSVQSFDASGQKAASFRYTIPPGEVFDKIMANESRFLLATVTRNSNYEAFFIHSFDNTGMDYPEKGKAAFSTPSEGAIIDRQWVMSPDNRQLSLIRLGRYKNKDSVHVNMFRFGSDLNGLSNQHVLAPLKSANNPRLASCSMMENGTALAVLASSPKGEEGAVSLAAFFEGGTSPVARVLNPGAGKKLTDVVSGVIPGRQFFVTGYFTTDSLPLKKGVQRLAHGIYTTGVDIASATLLEQGTVMLDKPIAGLICLDARIYKDRDILLLGEATKKSIVKDYKTKGDKVTITEHGMIVMAALSSPSTSSQRYISRTMSIDSDLNNDLPMFDLRNIPQIRLIYPAGSSDAAPASRPKSWNAVELVLNGTEDSKSILSSALPDRFRYQWRPGFSDANPWFYKAIDSKAVYIGTFRF